MSNAPATPAANTICLTNKNSYCLGINPGDAVVIAAVLDFIARMYEIYTVKAKIIMRIMRMS